MITLQRIEKVLEGDWLCEQCKDAEETKLRGN